MSSVYTDCRSLTRFHFMIGFSVCPEKGWSAESDHEGEKSCRIRGTGLMVFCETKRNASETPAKPQRNAAKLEPTELPWTWTYSSVPRDSARVKPIDGFVAIPCRFLLPFDGPCKRFRVWPPCFKVFLEAKTTFSYRSRFFVFERS